jgi:hypothetical protein
MLPYRCVVCILQKIQHLSTVIVCGAVSLPIVRGYHLVRVVGETSFPSLNLGEYLVPPLAG